MSYSFLLMFICIEKFQYTNCWLKSKTKNPPSFSSIEVIENISGLFWLFFFFPRKCKANIRSRFKQKCITELESWNRSQFTMELLWKLLLCVIALALERKVTIPPYMIPIWAIRVVTKLAAKPLWKEQNIICNATISCYHSSILFSEIIVCLFSHCVEW